MFDDVLRRLGIDEINGGVFAGRWIDRPGGEEIVSENPATGRPIARVRTASRDDYVQTVEAAQAAFATWRSTPPPVRGEVVRRIGLALREAKDDLGLLVTLESGKIRSEGLGEVQEMIDMCDFAVGLSRQLYGLTIASERPNHRLIEQWLPLGPVGVITAFNFPVAVWAWNAAVAAVCGDPTLWKPSPTTPLTAIAVQRIVDRVTSEMGFRGVFSLCIGAATNVGEWIADDVRIPLVSATGSCAMGRAVGTRVAQRLGRSLLELGGNNAAIVTPSADVELALRAVMFAAVGTAGQRCTTLRRLIVHEAIAESFTESLANAYESIRIGDPWLDDVLMGPLISRDARETMIRAITTIRQQDGEIVAGGDLLDRPGWFVTPTIVRAQPDLPILQQETFAPILYVLTYSDLDEAIAMQNGVAQGLASAIFTERLSEAERFLSPAGSDCGIANVNIGTSGAEIGGAFGGEKDTGGGREAGSDAWKAYMRRQTCTINYGGELPLAQGVRFDV
ncbi:MAG: aldehyde dehydrogenase family protein [Planctomycetaceae bacterium]